MSTVNSTWITNAVAVPKVLTDSTKSVGRVMNAKSVATVSATIPSGDIVRFVRVPSNARIDAVLLTTGDATTAGAIDIGIYQTADNGGAVVDADFFASAFALTNGPYLRSDQTWESGVYTYANSALPLWAALGLSVDPGIEYDVAATVTTTGNGMSTTMVLEVLYTA